MKTGEVIMSDGNHKDRRSAENVTPLRPALPCPECGKASNRENYPFCSSRCRLLDLNRWLSGSYVLPGRRPDEEQDD